LRFGWPVIVQQFMSDSPSAYTLPVMRIVRRYCQDLWMRLL